jgi:hypothetical protein
MRAALTAACNKHDACSAGELCHIAWGAAVGGVGLPQSAVLMERIWPLMAECSADLACDELAMMLWAHVASGYRSASFVAMMLSRILISDPEGEFQPHFNPIRTPF